MKWIIGIGNPGKSYDGTRHNVGFAVIDRLESRGNVQARLIKPKTFVNLSGEAVAAIAKKEASAQFLIVCDDVNLDFGKLRLRASGSAGGHHGLESIIAELGRHDFARLRVGVRNPDMPKDLTDFVLGKFSVDEKKVLETILERAALVCEAWDSNGFESARDRLSQLQSSGK